MPEGHEERIRRHAEAIWKEHGRPAGGPEAYLDGATELAAIEENEASTLKPVTRPGPYGEPVEESGVQDNLGEFPTLTDQGDEETTPRSEDDDDEDIDPVDPIENDAMEEIGDADRDGDDDDDDDDEDGDDDEEEDEDDDEEDDEDILRTDRERPLDETIETDDEE
jgi:hypothetical protein